MLPVSPRRGAPVPGFGVSGAPGLLDVSYVTRRICVIGHPRRGRTEARARRNNISEVRLYRICIGQLLLYIYLCRRTAFHSSRGSTGK